MHIVGTAGHVDHGKSALIRALTGADPDRWLEEQPRAMTLDLGFAHLPFDDGLEAGIVDVPGHERFLHNMLAGAAGMEIVLLVVAANEGVKPQTLEHLTILRFLNVRRVLIVLSKSDTVDAAEGARAATRVREALRGTIAADASMYPVSTITGEGLEALREAIHDALAALPERAPDAPAYLPVDGVFALPGHGTIVTGTLMQGRLHIGDTLRLSPLGRDVRVPGMRVFGEPRAAAGGGTRVAVNLPGVERSEIARGAVLASAQFALSARLDVRFRPLETALEALKRRTPVRAYIGAAEIPGTLVFQAVPASVDDVDAQLHLRRPTVAVPGAPIVFRRVSPQTLLGGAIIVSAHAPGAVDSADFGAHDDPEQTAMLAALRAGGLAGASAAQAGAAANIGEDRARAVLADLAADGRAIVIAKPPAYVAGDIAADVLARALERLEQRQGERPWLSGVTSRALALALDLPEPDLIRVLAAHVEAGSLAYRSGYYATLDFAPRLAPDQRAFFAAAFASDAGGAAVPVPFDRLRALMKTSSAPDLAAALETLLIAGALSRVGDWVYRGSHIAAIRSQLEAALESNGRITVAEFRDLTGTSRKFAVPLLEYFDAAGVTVRSGDLRVLRRKPAPGG